MSIKYVGRTTNFKGQTLWDILSNLKNFGVGRVIVRSSFERYPEKSYMRINKVEAMPTPTAESLCQRKCTVWVEKVFRGKKFDQVVKMDSVTYKKDYILLSKQEEAEYCQTSSREIKLFDQFMDLPPLLKEFVMKETGRSDVKMRVQYKDKTWAGYTHSRLAKEGEKPNMKIPLGIGKPHPTAASLYEGVKI